mmetsp:Transcript_13765/g.31931  ORF Transcript_13765/g.31931 Transcript_13765/m.31931 type:complete len:233 (-) Transcript_13765:226-924(-)
MAPMNHARLQLSKSSLCVPDIVENYNHKTAPLELRVHAAQRTKKLKERTELFVFHISTDVANEQDSGRVAVDWRIAPPRIQRWPRCLLLWLRGGIGGSSLILQLHPSERGKHVLKLLRVWGDDVVVIVEELFGALLETDAHFPSLRTFPGPGEIFPWGTCTENGGSPGRRRVPSIEEAFFTKNWALTKQRRHVILRRSARVRILWRAKNWHAGRRGRRCLCGDHLRAHLWRG